MPHFLRFVLLGMLVMPFWQAMAFNGHPELVSLGDLNVSQVQMGVAGGGATSSNGAAFFAGHDGEHGTEVWRYQGSGPATLFSDVRPGAESSNPEQFTAVGNEVVWVANDGVRGPEIHSSYPVSPYSPLLDLQPGASHPAPRILGSANGCVWFTTPSWKLGDATTTLWAMTSFGNPVEAGIYERDSIIQVSTATTQLFFVARLPGGDPRHQLFRVSATQNAQSIADLDPSASGAIPPAQSYAATQNFVCYREVSGTFRLRVQNLGNGQTSTLPVSSSSTILPWFATNGTDRVCFAGDTAANGVELWTTLGTVATTTLLADLNPGAGSSTPSRLMMSAGNPGVFFQIEDGATRDLYFINPVETPAAVARKLRDSVQTSAQFAIVDADEIALGVPDGSITSIWLGDGKYGGGQWIGPVFSSVSRLWNANAQIPQQRQLNVVATTSSAGEELYRLDNTTLSLLSLNNNFGASASPRGFFSLGVDQMFVADTHSEKDRLFRLSSTGSLAQITMQTPPDVHSSNASSLPDEFTECGGVLLFTADNGTQRRLYVSDGEGLSGTVMNGIYEPEQLVKFQDRVFMLGYATQTATGIKQLFQAQISGGNVTVTTFDHATHSAKALIAAAGKLFFVEPTPDGQEQLQSILADFTLPAAPKFSPDASGTGITQLTASSGHVYFSAREFDHPLAKRVLWGSDGTLAGTTALPAGSSGIENPQLLGSLDDRCVFWCVSPSGDDYFGFAWDADLSGPTACVNGPLTDAPEPNRLPRRPAGVELGGRFYFTTSTGRVLSTDGSSVDDIFSSAGALARPESLAVLGDRLLFLHLTAYNSCRLYSYSTAEGLRMLRTFSDLTLHCPLQQVGGHLYFTIAELNYNIGHPDLWRTDGTPMGTELVLHDVVDRETAYIPMGSYRGHLVLGAAHDYPWQGIEPALLNFSPMVSPPPLITGARKELPFQFTYEQIVAGGAVDADGDALQPFRITSWSDSLKKNGAPLTSTMTAEILPGDVFEWTPPADAFGNLQPLSLEVWDEWNLGSSSVLIRVETAHEEWMQAHFTPEELADPAVSGSTADADGDGVANALEFIFGREPKQREAQQPWQFSATPASEGMQHLQFTFTRVATLAAGTVLTVESSTDLTYWTAATSKVENGLWDEGGVGGVTITESALPGGLMQVVVAMDVASEPGTYLRLRVTLP